MKLSPSLELALQLAAQEALAAAFTEIEPEHLLMGLLKFAELPLPHAEADPQGAALIQPLLADNDALRERLRRRNIDSAQLRRQLRMRLGRGGGVVGRVELHRSPASRQRFDEAAAIAHAENTDVILAVHLLDAVLAAPTPLIRELVQREGKPGNGGNGRDDHLSRHGRDLIQLAAAGQLPAIGDRNAEVLAMRRVLEGSHAKSVLGICPSLPEAMCIVQALAKGVQAAAEPAAPAMRRLIDLSELVHGNRPPAEILERLRTALLEAADAPDVVAVVPLVGDGVQVDQVWPMVQTALLETRLRAIVLTTPDLYEQVFAADRRWLRRMHALWLRAETVPPKIPQVLGMEPPTIFTEAAERLFQRAKDEAAASKRPKVDVSSLTAAIRRQPHARRLLAECLGREDGLWEPAKDAPRAIPRHEQPMAVASALRSVLDTAWKLGQEVPDLRYPGRIDLRHLVGAAAMSPQVCVELGCSALAMEAARRQLDAWYAEVLRVPVVDELSQRLRHLREELLAKVFGQDHAVQAFVEGLFNAEVVAGADQQRKSPQAIFVFAGPPGVGKTYLATLGAAALDRPFQRFDMSSYSGHQQHEQLVGEPPAYRGAKPGDLTGFVQANPTAVLLFDEIEKASRRTIHLFLQLLDAGTLQDQHTDKAVSFRDTIIIFTTNAGRKLYDNPDRAGAWGAGRAFHRRTILSALETEKNPETGEPFFPEAICSRMATGYPVLFNHLGVNELGRVVEAELHRVGQLLSRQFKKEFQFGPLLPLTLVLREGAHADARTLRAQTEIFAKTEMFKLSQLFAGDRLETMLGDIDRIRYDVELEGDGEDAQIAGLFRLPRKPRVLLVTDPQLAHTYEDFIGEIEWRLADQPEDALRVLGQDEIDLVLFDIWLGKSSALHMRTVRQFDHAPLGARGLARGQELLHAIHERLPDMPVYLLSVESAAGSDSAAGPAIDDDLLAACVRAGGVRGVIATRLTDSLQTDFSLQRDQLVAQVLEVAQRTWREKTAAQLGHERKILQFVTAPLIDEERQEIVIRLRQLQLSRALSAVDAGEVLADVERPQATFEQVIGADEAKEELRFFIDFLKNPRRLAASGLKLPKGVLLHGPPGTGKTLLARAMAGESDVAFLPVSASNFVTIWQGSGPQNIRDLFARARRYAPAVIFIDEIDAIGKTRTGGPGSKAEENTLNALLTEMDGFTGPTPSRPVFVLAATNFRVEGEGEDGGGRSSNCLDPALVRRFDRAIFVGLPDLAARRRYLKLRLLDREGSSVSEEIVNLVAERSTGMSIANLEAVIETAIRDALRSGADLTGKHLEEALERTRYGQARPRTQEEKLRTARHEAGHSILYWLSGWWPSYVTIVSRGGHGGYMAPSPDEAEKGGYSRAELEAKIRTILGGRAAEFLYYGPEAGLTTGASSDLERATSLVRQMICRFGMDDEFGLLATPELLQSPAAVGSPLFAQVNQLAAKVLKKQFDEACRLLREQHAPLEALVKLLMRQERVTGEQMRALLAAAKGVL